MKVCREFFICRPWRGLIDMNAEPTADAMGYFLSPLCGWIMILKTRLKSRIKLPNERVTHGFVSFPAGRSSVFRPCFIRGSTTSFRLDGTLRP